MMINVANSTKGATTNNGILKFFRGFGLVGSF